MDLPIRLADQLRAHLQALRKQRGLTQAQLGLRLGLSQVRIADIEARPGSVSVEQLVVVLSALGATLTVRSDKAAAVGATARPQLTSTPNAKPSAAPRKPQAALLPPPARTAPVPRQPAKASPKKGSW